MHACSTVADLKIEGDAVVFFLPTYVAPRYHPGSETSHVPSSTITHVPNGLHVAVQCTMASNIVQVVSPSHQIVYDLSSTHF